jgi:hydroxylamine reductase
MEQFWTEFKEKITTMDNKMFCFQCEQTAGCSGCAGNMGVCGKNADISKLQDELIGALIGLARASDGHQTSESTHRAMIEGLFTTLTNVSFKEEFIRYQIDRVRQEKEKLIPGYAACASPCDRNDEYDMNKLWTDNEDIRSLKSLILFGLKGMAAYAYHALVLGYSDEEVNNFFYEGLFAVGENLDTEQFFPVVMKVGEVNLKCMELLDKANTETYGNPVPTTVSLQVEKGPFIVISGHDLRDLQLLLQQTEGKGINIYTHGEMLPAHGYPMLKKYPHFKGNYGTAWQNQQKEFANLPAPILFTTNCLMPPKDSYADRVFTTEMVSYPGMAHIEEDKDFTPVIDKALELGGFAADKEFTGINGGKTLTTGYGHNTVLSVAKTVIEAVKSGDLKHIFLVGGCDGARPGRNYYTEFVKQTPADTAVLTLACGKFRFNDLNLGTIGGLPRIMDMGQCNDAYSAIKVAVALAEAFGCGVNELPLTLVLSWYEQKAVSILLTLLHLGIKNIYLGPTLPAFISSNVLDFLVKNYEIHPITTPEQDLAEILK